MERRLTREEAFQGDMRRLAWKLRREEKCARIVFDHRTRLVRYETVSMGAGEFGNIFSFGTSAQPLKPIRRSMTVPVVVWKVWMIQPFQA